MFYDRAAASRQVTAATTPHRRTTSYSPLHHAEHTENWYSAGDKHHTAPRGAALRPLCATVQGLLLAIRKVACEISIICRGQFCEGCSSRTAARP